MTSSLIISNLPTVLSQEESQDLLNHFHAEQIHVFKKCRKKRAIYARFPTVAAAQHALQELHQAKLGGTRLMVEYASDHMSFRPVSADNWSSSDRVSAGSADRLASFPLPSPLLRYAYPPPSADSLARICAALRSSPRFYSQVLHLMNKLSLPAPFAAAAAAAPVPAASVATMSATPPPPAAKRRDAAAQTEPAAESESDSAESELASDGESAVRRLVKRRRPGRLPDGARRLRAARLQRHAPAANPAPAVPLSEVFEGRQALAPARRPKLKLPAEPPAPATNGSAPPAAEAGFAKLYPSREQAEDDTSQQHQPAEDSEFVTDTQLAENRLRPEDMKVLPVFARYSRGDVSARLYIKNLDKRVVLSDLRRVYGRYIDWTENQHKNAFDIRLMQEGRMKGQAFISLPNPAAAERALSDTHGFILRDKPIVVQFARSARPKDSSS